MRLFQTQQMWKSSRIDELKVVVILILIINALHLSCAAPSTLGKCIVISGETHNKKHKNFNFNTCII